MFCRYMYVREAKNTEVINPTCFLSKSTCTVSNSDAIKEKAYIAENPGTDHTLG
jgi:hypothetical protein